MPLYCARQELAWERPSQPSNPPDAYLLWHSLSDPCVEHLRLRDARQVWLLLTASAADGAHQQPELQLMHLHPAHQ